MRAATDFERADRERDYRKHDETPRDRERLAAAALIGYCEGIVSSGILRPDGEAALRVHIAAALAAFNMPSKAERANA